MNTTSESLLFRLQSSGESVDQTAWEQFVSLYTPLIFHWGRKVGLGQADAENLVQDVVTTVFRQLPNFQYDKSRSFRGWLRTVTLNTFRTTARKKSSKVKTATASVLEGLASFEEAESTWDIDYARMLVIKHTDPWGEELRFDLKKDHGVVRSAGPDMVFETPDDIVKRVMGKVQAEASLLPL